MSRSTKDQRGGHPRREKPKSGILDCRCCEHYVPDAVAPERVKRERAALRYERAAEGFN